MLANGELGPGNKTDSTGEYIPSIIGSPLFHGLIYNPVPALSS